MTKLVGLGLVCSVVVLAPAAAGAQAAQAQVVITPIDAQPVSTGAQGMAVQPPMAQPPPVVQAPVATDGVRFRGAIAASGGSEFASGFAVGMGGVEGRVGVQINNLIGLYVQPSLAFGAGSVNGSSLTVFTGTAGVSALVDFTIENYFFVGIGGGVGILNNPVGPEIHFRIGGYPVMAVGEDGYSRQGLVLAVDARVFILSAGSEILPVSQIMGSIGYEVF